MDCSLAYLGYVADILCPADDRFRHITAQTKEKCDMDEDQHNPCTCTSFSVSRLNNGTIVQHQHAYLRKLEEQSLDSTSSS